MRKALLLLSASAVTCAVGATADDLKSILQKVADQMRDKYDMGIAAAVHSSDPQQNVAVASGYTDSGIGLGVKTRKTQPDDKFVWGSTTKMFTAPAVLQLVEKGVVALTDPITQHIDPILQHLNGTGLADHFGEPIKEVQIQHLLHMTSGIHDYDGESYAHDQFANRSRDFSPVEIIGNYVEPQLRQAPGTRQSYCSTNYILLGLVLANHYHKTGTTWSWEGYDQTTVIPEALRKAYTNTEFVNKGTCQQYTPVHGFMEGYSTAKLPPQDVWNVSCAGGFTAGNYVGSVSDVARFTYQLYNTKQPQIVSKASQDLMTNFTAPRAGESRFNVLYHMKFYGMGTFSLDWSYGPNGGSKIAYGHVGDTYGYQSQTTYIPELDIALTVATNVETNSQAQPADFTCVAANAIKSLLKGTSAPNCTFSVFRRFIGTCKCSDDDQFIV